MMFARRSCVVVIAVLVATASATRAVQPEGYDVLERSIFELSLPQGSPADPQFPISGLNDGSRGPAARPTIFLDSNGPAGTVDFARVVGFSLAPSRICGVTLYTLADGGVEDGLRGVSNFQLRAMQGAPFNPPGVVLVDGVNPRDDGSPNTYTFPETEVWGVYAFFTRSTDAGPRVVELDGIGIIVPEPGSAAVTIAGLAALLLRRRRR